MAIYEHRTQPLLSRAQFGRRLLAHVSFALGVMAVALGIGVVGYRLTEGMPWIDALLNASMILGGMGPVDPVRTDAGKWFASAYALYSGLVVLIAASILIAPIAHRILHRMHLQEDEQTGKPQR